jgi:hypothetical protein
LLIKLLGHVTIMEPNFNGTLYNETNDSNLSCHTTDPQGRGARWLGLGGEGGVGGEPTAKNLASSHRHCSRSNTTVQDCGSGLFIGQSY